MTQIPRGVRNHNPGNIERNQIKWEGMAADQSGDPRFVVFVSAPYGIRAMAKVLLSYQRGGQDTIRKMISRWAPPGGADNNHTDVYVAAVARAVGVTSDDRVDVGLYAIASRMIVAMIKMECAQYTYPREVIDAGLRLAGITPAGVTPSVTTTAPRNDDRKGTTNAAPAAGGLIARALAAIAAFFTRRKPT